MKKLARTDRKLGMTLALVALGRLRCCLVRWRPWFRLCEGFTHKVRKCFDSRCVFRVELLFVDSVWIPVCLSGRLIFNWLG
jgi:hypothetical protein